MSDTIICSTQDLVPNSGVCALHEDQQIALFYLPDTEQKIFALGNWDPLGKANVMSRGMLGNIGDELVVASPLYKQRFSLITGACLEEEASLPVYKVVIESQHVVLKS